MEGAPQDLPQVRRVDVDGPRPAVVLVAPDPRQQDLAGEDLARVLGEELEQLVFHVGEIERSARHRRLVGLEVQHEVAVFDEVGPLQLLGYIDRIDQQGQSAIVIDYKSGGTRIPVKELQEGRNFQMMVYLLAAEAILNASEDEDAPTQVSGGLLRCQNSPPLTWVGPSSSSLAARMASAASR